MQLCAQLLCCSCNVRQPALNELCMVDIVTGPSFVLPKLQWNIMLSQLFTGLEKVNAMYCGGPCLDNANKACGVRQRNDDAAALLLLLSHKLSHVLQLSTSVLYCSECQPWHMLQEAALYCITWRKTAAAWLQRCRSSRSMATSAP